MKYLNTISAIFLAISGFFLAAYGWWELQVSRGNYGTNPLVDLSLKGSGRLSNWVNDVGGGRFAMACLMIVIGIIAWVIGVQKSTNRERFIPIITFLSFLLIVEFSLYSFDLLIVPVLRTIADFPDRISNWFTDPIRWASLWELVASLILVLILWPSIGRLNAFFKTKEKLVDTNGN